MKFHILSDIHREKIKYKEHKIPVTDSDAIIFAGDIDNGFKSVADYCKRIAQDHQKPVFYVLGNNCMYGQDLYKLKEAWYGADIDSVFYLDDGIRHQLGKYTLHGCGLWPMYQGLSTDEIIDNDKIRLLKGGKNIFGQDGNIITAFEHIEMTKKSIELLDKGLGKQKDNIVITHFAPSFKSQYEHFPNDTGHGAHANNIENFILSHDVKLRIHGHIHFECEYHVGETLVYANPMPPGIEDESRYSRVIEV